MCWESDIGRLESAKSKMKRASFAALCATLACMLACLGAAEAQPFPSRPVTLIVPFGAGGPVDTLARTLSEAMRGSLGQPVIIENVTGASGTIGVGSRRARGARRLHGEHRQLAVAHRQRRDLLRCPTTC